MKPYSINALLDIIRQRDNSTVCLSYRLPISRTGVAPFSLIIICLFAGINGLFSMTLHQPVPQSITLDAKMNYPVISEQGGTAYLQFTLRVPSLHKDFHRKPINLAVVFDRSGSMSDQRKMEYAKKAFAALIDQLHSDDFFSLVIYDDVIDVIRRSKKIGNDKAVIKRMLDEVYPRNSTNLGGGLIEGLRQVERHAGKEYVNRVILLSDGLANVGLTDPAELNKIARRHRNRSISITAMGVGLDYNENLMMGLSESGGGNYYFIEHPNSLASIIRREFEMVASIVAQNSVIHINPGDQVVVRDVIGCEFRNEQRMLTIPLGDLYANDTREITVELTIPSGTGKRSVATGALQFEHSSIINTPPKFSVYVTYTKDYAEIERSRDIDAQGKADVALSSRKVEEAMRALDAGDQESAEMQLNDAKDLISRSPAASAMGAGGESVRMQMEKIESYQKTAKEETDARKAKKSIQYDNYKTRRNK